jgi:hypothetical protein
VEERVAWGKGDAGGKGHVLVTITDNEIGVQFPQIHFQMSHPMRAIHKTQYPQFFTRSNQSLKRHAHTWHTHHCVECSKLHLSALRLDFFDFGDESVNEPVIFYGIRERNFSGFRRRRFGNVFNRLLARAVYR